jgi:hypothetical protein
MSSKPLDVNIFQLRDADPSTVFKLANLVVNSISENISVRKVCGFFLQSYDILALLHFPNLFLRRALQIFSVFC